MPLTWIVLSVAATPLVFAAALLTAPVAARAARRWWLASVIRRRSRRAYLRFNSHRYRRQLNAWKAGERDAEPSLPRASTMHVPM